MMSAAPRRMRASCSATGRVGIPRALGGTRSEGEGRSGTLCIIMQIRRLVMPRPRNPRGPSRKRPPWARAALTAALALGGIFLAAVLASAFYVFAILPRSLPSVAALENYEPIQGARVFDDNDELITELQ